MVGSADSSQSAVKTNQPMPHQLRREVAHRPYAECLLQANSPDQTNNPHSAETDTKKYNQQDALIFAPSQAKKPPVLMTTEPPSLTRQDFGESSNVGRHINRIDGGKNAISRRLTVATKN